VQGAYGAPVQAALEAEAEVKPKAVTARADGAARAVP